MLFASAASAQPPLIDKGHFHELFKYKVQGKGNAAHFHVEPDSTQLKGEEHKRYAALYWANDYLYNNYSNLYRHGKELVALRGKPKELRAQFARRFAEDSAFQHIYMRSVEREMIAPLHIDSALRIASHFYYVHKMDGQPTVHICVGINKVKDLSTAMEHPYYAAFCYMAICGMQDVRAPYKLVREPYAEEVKTGVSDARLEEIEQEVYTRVAALPMLRQVLIDTYERKAKYLNFELLY